MLYVSGPCRGDRVVARVMVVSATPFFHKASLLDMPARARMGMQFFKVLERCRPVASELRRLDGEPPGKTCLAADNRICAQSVCSACRNCLTAVTALLVAFVPWRASLPFIRPHRSFAKRRFLL